MSNIISNSELTAKCILFHLPNYYDFLSLARTSKTMYALSKDEELNRNLLPEYFENALKYKTNLNMKYYELLKYLFMFDFLIDEDTREIEVQTAKFLSHLKPNYELLLSYKFINDVYETEIENHVIHQNKLSSFEKTILYEVIQAENIDSLIRFLITNSGLYKFDNILYLALASTKIIFAVLDRQIIESRESHDAKVSEQNNIMYNKILDYNFTCSNLFDKKKREKIKEILIYGRNKYELNVHIIILKEFSAMCCGEIGLWLADLFQLNKSEVYSQCLLKNDRIECNQIILFMIANNIEPDFNIILSTSCYLINMLRLFNLCGRRPSKEILDKFLPTYPEWMQNSLSILYD